MTKGTQTVKPYTQSIRAWSLHLCPQRSGEVVGDAEVEST